MIRDLDRDIYVNSEIETSNFCLETANLEIKNRAKVGLDTKTWDSTSV